MVFLYKDLHCASDVILIPACKPTIFRRWYAIANNHLHHVDLHKASLDPTTALIQVPVDPSIHSLLELASTITTQLLEFQTTRQTFSLAKSFESV